MTTWNDRLLPFPLLAGWTDDYGEATFRATVPHALLNNGHSITLTLKYHLTSSALRELVSRGQAQYVGLLVCTRTFHRSSYATSAEDDVQVLEAGNYSGELKLTPYIVATQPLAGFISPEHAPEIRAIKPEGFDIPAGSILAVGDATDIALEEGGSPYSVIDLVADDNIDRGSFKVVLDDNRIKIHLAREDKDRLETLRNQEERKGEMQAIFFPAIYLHAITEALRNLAEPDYVEKHWVNTLRSALARHHIAAEGEELAENALSYAQTLMENPVGKLLTSFGSGEE